VTAVHNGVRSLEKLFKVLNYDSGYGTTVYLRKSVGLLMYVIHTHRRKYHFTECDVGYLMGENFWPTLYFCCHNYNRMRLTRTCWFMDSWRKWKPCPSARQGGQAVFCVPSKPAAVTLPWRLIGCICDFYKYFSLYYFFSRNRFLYVFPNTFLL